MRTPRTRKAMIEFLAGHARYNTMNSWKASTSYSRNVKLSHIQFPDKETRNRAWDMLNVEEAMDDVNWVLREFAELHNWEYQIGFNGRSGGYLVLYKGGRKTSNYKSFCPHCGQGNCNAVLPEAKTPKDKLLHYLADHNHWTPETYLSQPEVMALGLSDDEVIVEIKRLRSGVGIEVFDGNGKPMRAELKHVSPHNVCGRCRAPSRKNWLRYENFTMPGQSVDGERDWEDWSTWALKDQVKLVMEFDRACEDAVQAFISFCQENKAEEQTIMVPQKVMVAVPA